MPLGAHHQQLRRAAPILRRVADQLDRAGHACRALADQLDHDCTPECLHPELVTTLAQRIAALTGQAGQFAQRLAHTQSRVDPAAPRRAFGPLTQREAQVAQLVAEGFTDVAIAASLKVSIRTVHSHVHHVLAKLGLHDRQEVTIWYRTGGGVGNSPDTTLPPTQGQGQQPG